MYKIRFFFIFLFFLFSFAFFPSFSSQEKKKQSSHYKSKAFLSHPVKEFSFEPSPIIKKIFKKPRTLYLKGETKRAYEKLKSFTEPMIYNEISKRKNLSLFERLFYSKKKSVLKEKEYIETYEKIKFLRNYALGVWAFEINQLDESFHYLTLSLKQAKQNYIKPFIHYYFGLVHLEQEKLNQAEKAFHQIFLYNNFKNRNLFQKARFELGQIALHKGDLNLAFKHLRYLEKKWRKNEKHPEVLWALIKIAKRKKEKCYWARKIYSLYPTHPLILDWTFNLKSSLFEKKALGCEVRYRDLKRRILNFQRFGESRRAEDEIQKMKKKIKEEKKIALTSKKAKRKSESFLWLPSKKQKKKYRRNVRGKRKIKTRNQMIENHFNDKKYKIDSLYALFLIYEGYPKKAFHLLHQYFDQKKDDFEYLKLFGKASRESGNYKLAVKAYYESSKNQRRAQAREKALFYSGFLSFRFKDYDTAYEKFEEFKRKYKKSKLYSHAFWYSAWIQYLKKNYSTAIERFQEILSLKEKKKKLFSGIFDKKIHYWTGVSYLNLGKKDQARKEFFKLLSDKSMNYYTIASYYRLESLDPFLRTKSIKNILDYQKKIAEDENIRELSLYEPSEDNDLISFNESENEDSANPNGLNPSDNAKKESFEFEPIEPVKEPTEDMHILASDAKRRRKKVFQEKNFSFEEWNKIREQFESIKNFIHTGAFHWAKWSLYEIELSTKKEAYRKLLMEAYKKIQSFHRSSYISTVYFDEERETLGLFDGEFLWKSSFPQAYFELVKNQSDQLKISKNLIWAVMRAESNYRYNTISPVGAKGLMQVMPYTAHKVREKLLNQPNTYNKNLMDPQTNIAIGVSYIKHLLEMFKDQIPLAAAAYNAGPHRVEKWISSFGSLETDEFIEHIPFLETRNYVKKVIRNYKIYQYLYENEQKSTNWFTQPVTMFSLKERKKRREASLDF